MKAGDKLWCKDSLLNVPIFNQSIPETLFEKGKWYEIIRVENNEDNNISYFIKSDTGELIRFYEGTLETNFYTVKQIRKMKLDRIKH